MQQMCFTMSSMINMDQEILLRLQCLKLNNFVAYFKHNLDYIQIKTFSFTAPVRSSNSVIGQND